MITGYATLLKAISSKKAAQVIRWGDQDESNSRSPWDICFVGCRGLVPIEVDGGRVKDAALGSLICVVFLTQSLRTRILAPLG